MNYFGTIIEESLSDASILEGVKILSTKVEPITPKHQTPWLKAWTLHKVEVEEHKAREFAQKVSLYLDYSHKNAWYADFRNDQQHYIVFKDKIFLVQKGDKEAYGQAKDYGIALGIPEHQMGFPQNL